MRWGRPPEYYAQPGRGMKARAGGGVLLTQAIHLLDLMLVLAGPEAIQRRIDYPEIEDGIYELEGVVSRKKQLLPYLTHCLAQAGA